MSETTSRLRLGAATDVPDGTWFAVSLWDDAQRDYRDAPERGLHRTVTAARAAGPEVGARPVR
ncbi:MAG TPA: hypothetical protein VLH79_07145, partial [Chthonomonadales bacterium]|nr:hypothetical protein [Chthonomonadales bacterium]